MAAGEKRDRPRGRGDARDRGSKRGRYGPNVARRGRGRGGGGGWAPRGGIADIRGPGFFITCPRKKEAISVTEAYDVLNEIGDELYPETSTSAVKLDDSSNPSKNDNDDEDEEDIEAQIARELGELQPKTAREKRAMRFNSVKTDCECLIWIACQPPCDPVRLAEGIVHKLQGGAPVRTRYLQRMYPVSGTTHADPASLKTLAYKVLRSTFAPEDYTEEERENDSPIRYRIEPFLRNHTTSLNREIVTSDIGEVVRDLTNPNFQFPSRESRDAAADLATSTANSTQESTEQKDALADATQGTDIIEEVSKDQKAVAGQSPSGEDAQEGQSKDGKRAEDVEPTASSRLLPPVRRRAHVDLKNPTHVILVSALKGVCGISIVKDYDKGKKYNLQSLGGQLAPTSDKPGEGAQAAAKEGATGTVEGPDNSSVLEKADESGEAGEVDGAPDDV